jgi:uncharacterized protein YciI
MTAEEMAAMQAHSEYWQGLTEKGTCLLYGPVLDPDAPWGLAVVEADTDAQAAALFAADPAVTSARCTAHSAPFQLALMRGQAPSS